MMGFGIFVVEPFSLSIGENSISVIIQHSPTHNVWEVTAVISRAPDQPQIRGEEIDVQLIDQQGAALSGLGRPSGPLVEAGGSLGTSANARFQFYDSGTPAELTVTYQAKTVRFQVVSIMPR